MGIVIYVLDFDDTLINNHQLKSDYSLLSNYGSHPAVLKKAFVNSHRYIFSDALEFLEKCKNEKIVLSHCPSPYLKYQKLKINSSGLADFFKNILITPEFDKVSAMAKIISKFPLSPIYFIDDREVPLVAVKKAFPQVITFRIKRFAHQEPTVSPHIDFEIENLNRFAEKDFFQQIAI